MTTPSVYKHIRQECAIRSDTSKSVADAMILETDRRAIDLARRVGIQRPAISRFFDIFVVCGLTDYPMWLLGPAAPKIRSYQDAWALGYPARYIIDIQCQDELDELDLKWRANQIFIARKLVKAYGRREGLKKYQKTGNWAPNVMKMVRKGLDQEKGDLRE